MKKFLVLYMAPAAGVEEWMKIDPETRKTEEEKMQTEWNQWMSAHKDILVSETAGAGKTKRITGEGVTDVKNDLMLFDIVQGKTHDDITKAFLEHPHLQIPDAWIEIMPINPLSAM